MPSQWLSIFTPDMLAPLGYAAWAALAFGLVLWFFGVAIARIGVAAALGTLAAALAVLLASYFQLTVSPAIVGGVGFIAGAIVGAMGFRLMQGFSFAVVLALAVGGTYYHWHARTPVPTDIAAETPAIPATPAPAPSRHAHAIAAAPQAPAVVPAPASQEQLAKLVADLRAPLAALTIDDQKQMLASAGIAALVALLVAFIFPKMTTATLSALVGSLFILTAANLFMATHQVTSASPTLPAWWPAALSTWAIILAILACLSLAIQYRFFIRRSDKPQMNAA